MNTDSKLKAQNELESTKTSSNSNTNTSWRKGWDNSETNKSGTGWASSWGNATKDSASKTSSNDWGNFSAAKPKGSFRKGWGDPSARELSAPKTSGWGKGWASSNDSSANAVTNENNSAGNSNSSFEGNGWGKNISSIPNPFTKKDENADSSEQKNKEKTKSYYETFKVAPPKPRITFCFGTDKEFQSTNDPNIPFEEYGMVISSFVMPKPPPQRQKPDVDDSAEITLPLVDEKTGEEEEEVLFNEKAKAYALRPSDKDDGKTELVEIGIGEFHFNHSEKDNCYRMTMRRDQQNIVLNTRIFKGMNPRLVNNKCIRFLAPMGKDQDALKVHTYRFENEEKAKRLYNLIVDTISKL